jgi:hypothetical protein
MSFFQAVVYVVLIVITVLLTKYFPLIKRKIFSFKPLFTKYWIYSLFLIVLSLVLNYINFKYNAFNIKDLKEGSDFINFYTGITFAIFTGYYAFRQMELSRFDKLLVEAYEKLRTKSYVRAKMLYCEALTINSKDLTVISNLSELALFINDKNLFFENTKRLDRLLLKDEKILYQYLMIVDYLLDEEIGKAKTEINKLLTYIGNNPSSYEQFAWSFDDIHRSDRYTKLTGEAKILLDKLIKLLQKQMTPEDRQNFFNISPQ